MTDVHPTVIVQYAKCPDESDRKHWMVFDLSTNVRTRARCLFCPTSPVEIGIVGKGYVSQSDSDQGYTLSEPKPC